MTYAQMSAISGLNEATLYKIAKTNTIEAGNITVKTAIKIKEKLSVDLWKYFTNK
jgi:hypothetical protein